MTGMKIDLLREPLLTVAGSVGRHGWSLPAVLAALGAGEELEFARLRPHQHHAWHAFLVQLGALVAHRRGADEVDLDEDAWRQQLLDLAGGGTAGEAAWHLMVDDLSLPACFQNPVPEGSWEPFKKEVETPDDLDVLVTSRNHDQKRARVVSPRPEHWIFALVSLQTMEGFLGRGNYGIARMNSGFGSRPCLAAAPDLTWPQRFARDVRVWLRARPGLVDEGYAYPDSDGHALLWTLPWDGDKTSARSLHECDPFFVEVCRRVRMVEREGALLARAAATEATFLDAKDNQGDTGDVWTPVNAEGKALTLGGSGFDYRKLTEVLFGGDYRRRPALDIQQEDGERPVLVAQVLVRGQGGTEGYHQRLLPLTRPVRRLLRTSEGLDALGERAKARVERAGRARKNVLRPALLALLQGGKEQLDFQDDRTDPWLRSLDRRVDSVFFEDLWEAVELPEGEEMRQWDRRLVALARVELDDALDSAASPIAQRPRAEARAELMFRGLARKYLSNAFSDAGDETTTDESQKGDQP